MWTETKVIPTMGVQTANPAAAAAAAAATKRKYELIPSNPEDSNDTYMNSCSPNKTIRWSSSDIPLTQSVTASAPVSSLATTQTPQTGLAPQQAIHQSAIVTTNNGPNQLTNLTTASNINLMQAPQSQQQTQQQQQQSIVNSNILNTPTPPVSTTVLTPLQNNVPSPPPSGTCEDSIAKLEVVAAVPCSEPWNTEPIVDSISKLQAVTVPGDTWGGGISTRSTLATALLSSDEFDDDDDDFEDEFEDDESTIPTYCPLRYPPCTPPAKNYMYPGGYSKPPNFYSEPFPQQNCSRTLNQQQIHHPHPGQPGPPPQSPHHPMRMSNFGGWSSGPTHNHQNNNYYGSPPLHEPNNSYSQQTIRCAENGKSYLELGSSNSFNSSINNSGNSGMNARHSKGCCDGRGMWCNSKICYKETRLKIRNLSMFKLSRFRQVSEQSLYRSVLICNTLKQIDKELESEGKDAMMHCPNFLPSQQQINSRLSMDPNECMNQGFLQSHPHQPHLQQHIHSPQQSQYSNSNSNSPSGNESSRDFAPTFNQMNSRLPALSFNTMCSGSDSLHPYDHHPFRDAQSGRATPFPAQTPTDSDSGYGDDDSNRTINWSSVLSLSSQSALDPLNNNDLFSTIPAATSISTSSSPPSSASSLTCSSPSQQCNTSPSTTTNVSGIFATQPYPSSGPTATPVSPSSIGSSPTSAWEYDFFDMDLGIRPEFTELLPSCKMSSSADDLFKSVSPALNAARYVHENELDAPAHIMVGS